MSMEEWKEYKLEEISCLSTGFPFKGNKYSKDGIRVVRGDNVTIGQLRWDTEKDKRWNEYFEREAEFSLRTNDIVIGMDGSRVGLNRAQIKEPDLPLLLAQRVACVRSNDKSIQKFLYYHIFSKRFVDYVKSIHTGTSIPHISLKQIGSFTIQLPPLATQQKIANILSSLDDKIEVNRRINEQLEELAQALFKSWFVDFEPFKDGEFVESELGMIPEGWKVGELSEIGDIVGGATPSKSNEDYYTENGISWITPKDLSINKNKFIDKGETDITELGYSKCSAKLMPKGSVLFSSRAPIGYIAIAKKELCTNQGFKSVVPKYAGTAFIYFYLKNNVSNIESMASGSTFKEASGTLMKSLKVIVPPSNLLQDFEEKVCSIFDKQETLEEEITHLTALRDTLLPKLMSGEIDVNERGIERT